MYNLMIHNKLGQKFVVNLDNKLLTMIVQDLFKRTILCILYNVILSGLINIVTKVVPKCFVQSYAKPAACRQLAGQLIAIWNLGTL
jgi:hypothetical protein